ncbi:MAG: hypothetical protein OQK68_03580 [Sedimenticola sp.]|nr:hypothetical protein [Sedimenticola sp.]MCW8946686.1 hypothetical protein [Sedimenticola sp.]
MNKHFLPLLVLTFGLSVLSFCAIADNHPANQTNDTTNEQSTWEKTKEAGAGVAESSQKIGAATVDKTKELYQSAKKNGSKAGQAVAETSRSIWLKTKEIGAGIADKTSEWGTALVDKSKSLYNKSMQSSEPQQTSPSATSI